jgi:hypothetical protein
MVNPLLFGGYPDSPANKAKQARNREQQTE